MKNKNELHLIENKYAVDKLKINNFSAWPLVRHRVFFEIFSRKINFNEKLRTRSKLQLIKNFFYGAKHLFQLKKYDFLFFNNADKRTLTKNKKQYDIFFDSWGDKVGQENALFIEWAINKHYSKEETYSKNVISDLILKLGSYLCALFVTLDYKDADVLDNIKQEYNLQFNTNNLLKNKLGEIKFYELFFKYIKPKAVFLISSFTKESVVIAAHLNGIKVYEAQHGYIGDNHQFYNSVYKFDALYYPDYLLSFGEQEKNNLPQDFIFKKQQLLPIGSLFLEETQINYTNSYLDSLKNNYKYIFCVTLQNIKEEVLLNWVTEQAKTNKNWLFILKPRHIKMDYKKYTKLDNCILLPENNVYQVLKYSNFNITIYSTTAIEASAFNAKTLFYNIDKLSEKYFDVSNMYASMINEGENIEKEHLIEEEIISKNYFSRNYYTNVANTNLTF
ncbi:hypothetical protein Q4512_03125 [Oceanihabitans sp. 2_MG-2023]|uniref:hypothetical protein n=1 Tax=Oceanihabitans sp. 2_MG-2023 TaxID=3062661 RepID=UPI0026E2722F|nr:hypothetical protein [Oceanihabitans sp. 2_MG-2023]MDO6595890.1 hypothetical protein [Oceanihabitans sp. 2_MG-2023]